jgi:hypothetical protein
MFARSVVARTLARLVGWPRALEVEVLEAEHGVSKPAARIGGRQRLARQLGSFHDGTARAKVLRERMIAEGKKW